MPTPNGTPPQSIWHTLPVEKVYSQLESQRNGLTGDEAKARLQKYGHNELQTAEKTSPWSILLDQFKNVLIIILLLATAISVGVSAFDPQGESHYVEAIAIGIIVLFAVFLGFIQEYRAERAIEALRQMAAPTATALRDGKEAEVAARDLVPGDVVLLQAGDRIPADLRLIEAVNLQVEEAALTGESVPVEKTAQVLANAELPLGDRTNLGFSGTVVTYGRGTAIVAATGMGTEFGKIAQMLQTVKTGKTPLQENLDKVGSNLARAAFVIVAIIVALGLYRGEEFIKILIFGIALAVAVVPEALPAVVTISLAIGLQRMVKRHALMRRLAAVETLGSTSVICSDKTGTLTKDEMTVRAIYVAGQTYDVSGTGYEPKGNFSQAGRPAEPDEALTTLLQSATLACDANIGLDEEGHWQVKGDPTEGALVVVAAKAGLEKQPLEAKYPRVDEIPFSSETKRMTTLHTTSAGVAAYTKGAPEVILSGCSQQMIRQNGHVSMVPLNSEGQKAILDAAHQMANKALRVLAIASKTGAVKQTAQQDMTFLGLVGMIDPPRVEAKAAVQTCEKAGVKVVMITGDHPTTAQAIGRELGILKTGRAVTGAELDAISESDFEREVEKIEVYARVSPAHKMRVVNALQKNNHIVAMTGDGVNDAPAIKKADIGIAMGITGTDVTKEAAAMTLTDDNFASIVAAVEEGRCIFGNIKKYLMYLLSSNIGEICLMSVAAILGYPAPLSAVQILYVNLATDGLPALALAVDPAEHDLMHRPPRNPRIGIFTKPVILLMVMGGLWSALVNFLLFRWAWGHRQDHDEAMSMVLVCLVLIEFFKAYSFRSDRHSVFRKPFENKWLNLAILWELIILAGIIYLPILQKPFKTFSLTLSDWAILLPVACTIIPVLEFGKWLVRRGIFGK